MSTLPCKRTRRMLQRRTKRARTGLVARRSNFFDTLCNDLTAIIAELAVQTVSHKDIDNNASCAHNLLEVGNVLAEGVAIAFGSWPEFRHAYRTKLNESVLRLVTMGQG